MGLDSSRGKTENPSLLGGTSSACWPVNLEISTAEDLPRITFSRAMRVANAFVTSTPTYPQARTIDLKLTADCML
ncbi:hypothetical protein L207DRAFT_516804 [Hyaloscypha variabilis F]|uniref:Uncharacterized protein n=1 Tax=Hyaloscypha variabilis (strain UAMH 11265 / GT02V1 / F) TaxID=1149755 RepID=A0A2J6R804_HYAVF|nr:hypothetical protein L207DRAFT_516804 [Hyaloscypha variabilis F]